MVTSGCHHSYLLISLYEHPPNLANPLAQLNRGADLRVGAERRKLAREPVKLAGLAAKGQAPGAVGQALDLRA